MKTKFYILLMMVLAVFACDDSGGPTANTLTGRGGSLARFAVTETHLYAVEDATMKVYQFMDDGALEKINEVDLGSGAETIYATGQRVFIGKNDGMVAFDITNPANPVYYTSYAHFVSCDPVVVQDTMAYVTLRSSGCRPSGANQLDVVNIKDPMHVSVVGSYALTEPYGLGIDGGLLFVCEGDHGLTLLDVSEPLNAKIIKHYPDYHAYDVIPNHGTLILTGNDGVAQYDYTDKNAMKKLSLIPVAK
ncbi:LVIVD repeat-containing protein [Chryseolinea lacunae]|uniref:LVIVD repeat-containing protein n=1 Tax=Chryseolinea lacunae TaxID=2801331 RepID=A0ABS1L1B9_9BACT|nr:hypothetical protein [Chryseolinea lacunae]MBL0744727.1 hypothetical protein [Chryseolinea lacunae]